MRRTIGTIAISPVDCASSSHERPTAAVVLASISIAHLLNDAVQSLIPAIYPIFKAHFALSFAQVGLLAMTLQVISSLLQPAVGLSTDRRPAPYGLAAGMGATLGGLLLLSSAGTFGALLGAVALMGIGSAIFHPEAARVARMASGGRHGFAQSVFQVGGNFGWSLGPLLAAFVVAPRGQPSIAWCSLLALIAIVLLWRIGGWYRRHVAPAGSGSTRTGLNAGPSGRRVAGPLTILGALIFSKYFYLASLNSYYTFYLMTRFHVSVRTAQIDLFVFLAAVAAGTMLGGPIGDRVGRKVVIWASILGVLPFTLMLPYASLFWTPILSVLIGLVLASAFSAIVVYAQELVPGRIGLISGVFYGFAFGMGGLGSALLGAMADRVGIETMYRVCAVLPLIGALAAFLPPDTAERPLAETRSVPLPSPTELATAGAPPCEERLR
jgi:MFS transporter, FSR family, fosmidomycin resistance protein